MDTFLGLDIGSISTNLVMIGARGDVLETIYLRGWGDPIQSAQEALRQMEALMPAGMRVGGIGTTGSGGRLAGRVVGADLFKNEITTHARAALQLHPDVRTILEIGGQDSKVTILRDGLVVDFAMNLICAAGTGSFLDAQARRLNISVEELSNTAIRSTKPTMIAGRCAVFAESDMIHKQQVGHRQEDILMGLCQALVRNYLNSVCRGKEILAPIIFQGGVSANLGMRRAFEAALKTEVVIPRHHMVMGAYGAALLVAEAAAGRTKFRSFKAATRPVVTRNFDCEDCANRCEILEILEADTPASRFGGRCRKWEREPLSATAVKEPSC
jgi:predicted CoA-substrate-specific enzyme activase